MPQQQQPMVVHQQQQRGGGGGILRTLLRPFLPEVSAGIDMADAALSGHPQNAIAQAAKALSGDSEETPPAEDPTVDTIDQPITIGAGGGAEGGHGAGAGHGSEEDPANEEPPGQEEPDFTEEQLAALHQLDSALPGVSAQFAQDPGLLDGVKGMADKLQAYYRRQAKERMV